MTDVIGFIGAGKMGEQMVSRAPASGLSDDIAVVKLAQFDPGLAAEEQQRRRMPGFVRGGTIGAIAMSELMKDIMGGNPGW